MSPAPALALALALLAAAAAAAAAPHDRPNALTKANASVVAVARPSRQAGGAAGGSPLLRVLAELAGPALRLLRLQLRFFANALPPLARLWSAGAVPPLFSASAAASSGQPDAAGSSRELPKAGVDGQAPAGSREDDDFVRVLLALVDSQLQLLDRQYVATVQSLAGLSSLAGADTVAPLAASLVGASSGGFDDPAAAGTADSSEEVGDLVL